jgi:hypothetical protein
VRLVCVHVCLPCNSSSSKLPLPWLLLLQSFYAASKLHNEAIGKLYSRIHKHYEVGRSKSELTD